MNPIQIAGFFVKLFSKQADTPSDGVKLVSIPLSHYVEIVRWTLDLSPLQEKYIEEPHPPAFHNAPVVSITQDSKKSSTPLLVLPDGTFIHESLPIMKYLVENYPKELGYLYPDSLKDKVLVLQEDFGKRLAVRSRQIIYWTLWQAKCSGLSSSNPLVSQTYTKVEATLYNIMEDKILPVLLQRLNINEESVAVALEECRATFKEVSDLLEKNEGRYLLGTEKLTAADISFASLAYPLVFPPQYVLSVDRMKAEEVGEVWRCEGIKKLQEEFRASPAGQFVLRLYKEERYVGKPYQSVTLRTTDRNKYPWQ